MALNSRAKGQRAERKAIELLQPVVNKIFIEHGKQPPALERNLMQSMKGGYDIVGLEWLALEVKHHETLHVADWWNQACRQSKENQIPVLLYKQNRVVWRVVLYGFIHSGERKVKCPCDVGIDAFLLWFELQLRIKCSKNSIVY